MWKKKEISVSSASVRANFLASTTTIFIPIQFPRQVVDLKAELFKKQQELAAEKARTGASTTKAVSLKPIKVWIPAL